MALTKEDLQAIRALMQEENAPINARLDKLEQTVQDDLSSLKSDVAKLNHSVEPKLDKVLEMVSSANERNKQVDRLEDKVDGHDHRIWALEQKAI